MTLTLDLGVLAAACALFYMGTKALGAGEKELIYAQYVQIISKWFFLFILLFASFEIMGDYTAQAELVYLFIGVLALWIMMFLLDMVMIMPKVIEALKKRGKR